MPKLRYAEIIAVFRDMEVPEKCPGCGALLRDETDLNKPTVRRYDYVLYYTKGQLAKEGDDKITNKTGTTQFDHEDGLTIPAHEHGELPSASADEDISGYMYFCENCACDELLAGGDVHRVEHLNPTYNFVPDLAAKQGWNEYALSQLSNAFIDKMGLGELYKGFLEEFAAKENGK